MRAPRLRSGALLFALVCGATMPAYAQTTTGSASASTAPATPPFAAGAEALANGKQAWDAGQYDAAESFYKTALDRGGLAPHEVVDAYVRIGSARAILKKTALARAAFRQAAAIDSHFRVPPEAGRKAAQIASLARRDEARVGSIVLRARIPASVPSAQSFKVDATLDGKHTATVARVGVDARDPASGKHFSHADVVATSSHFEIPAEVVAPGATLIVRVDALDAHDNRLSTREQRVHVEGSPVAAAPPPPPPPPQPSPTPPPAPAMKVVPISAPPLATSELPREERKDKDKAEGGGFWSSPWPYVIGGLALAGAGAAVYFGTRPSDDVSVGSARVTVR